MNKIILEEINQDKVVLSENGRYIIKKEIKEDVSFIIKSSVNVIIDIICENDTTCNYIFDIDSNSSLILNLLDASIKINRNIIININGINSKALINISSISLGENNYNINIYHNNKNTISNTNIHGIALSNNSIFIKNNGYIKKDSSNSKLNQDNKIIIIGDNNSKIEPNLFIDEYDVEASHGAYIGKFSEDELFYLCSRGLTEKESYNLLINGFLIGDFNLQDKDEHDIKEIINKYIN